MSNHSMQSMRAASVASAQHQAQAQGDQARQQLRVGQQAVQYKGAMFRTSLAMVKPGGMARAMMAKLKPRPKLPRSHDSGVHAVQIESVESAVDGDEEGARRRVERDGEGGERERQVERVEDEAPDGEGSSGDDESPEDAEELEGARPAGRRRVRVRPLVRGQAAAGRAGGVNGGVNAVAALRAPWADAAMDKGGLVELRRALVDRLLRAARGSDLVGWRKDWMSNIAAAYAARYNRAGIASLAVRAELPSMRELFIERSKALPEVRLLPHRARETMFCLLWPVVHGLKCPRTAAQVTAMMARQAALVRVSTARRLF